MVGVNVISVVAFMGEFIDLDMERLRLLKIQLRLELKKQLLKILL